MTPMILAAALTGAAMAWHAWRIDVRGRVPAVVAALVAGAMLAVLAWRPTRETPGRTALELDDDATFAEVEAAAMQLAPGATVTITGDGLDSASLALLTRHRITWQGQGRDREVVALAWPHRAVIGERATIEGAVGARDSAWVMLEHPDGAVDSVRTDSAFRFAVVPRAAGTWRWSVRHRAHVDTIGMQVVPPPAPRIAWIEGRPNREASVLGDMVVAQGGGMLQRTRLTATDVRSTRYGAAPEGDALTGDVLRGLDAVVIGPGGQAVLNAAERSAIRAAIDSGLGVVHLVDTAMTRGAVMPFAVRSARGDERARVAFDDGSTANLAIPVSPVTLTGGDVFLRSTTGAPLAWRAAIGRGMVVATRLVQPSRWELAGEPQTAAAWWSALMGAAMRAPRAAWRVHDAALARVDHPLVVERVGEPGDSASVIEAGIATTMSLATGADSLTKLALLWPRDTGWITLAQEGDTIRLKVAARNAHASLDRAARRAATATAVARQHDTAESSPIPARREPVALWWAWVTLVAALATQWARRTT